MAREVEDVIEEEPEELEIEFEGMDEARKKTNEKKKLKMKEAYNLRKKAMEAQRNNVRRSTIDKKKRSKKEKKSKRENDKAKGISDPRLKAKNAMLIAATLLTGKGESGREDIENVS